MFNFFNKPKTAVQLPVTTDIHCHIIPGVDDGSPDTATSVALIERMQKWGIDRIIASPHVTAVTFENTPDVLDAAMAELQTALDVKGNTIKLSHHAEYRLDDFSRSYFDRGEIMAMPGNYVMIENPFVTEAWFIDNLVFELQMKGYIPLLAHPERYSYYFKNRERYRQLHDAGTKFQINILSLAGTYGKEQREIAEYLIANDMVEFIGSDLHNANHADAIDAYLFTKQAHNHFSALQGKLLNDSL